MGPQRRKPSGSALAGSKSSRTEAPPPLNHRRSGMADQVCLRLAQLATNRQLSVAGKEEADRWQPVHRLLACRLQRCLRQAICHRRHSRPCLDWRSDSGSTTLHDDFLQTGASSEPSSLLAEEMDSCFLSDTNDQGVAVTESMVGLDAYGRACAGGVSHGVMSPIHEELLAGPKTSHLTQSPHTPQSTSIHPPT